MPVYQYACTECGQDLEVRQSFTDDALTECPACSGRLRKVLSAVGVVFKGSGFYRNDSRAPAAEGASATAGKESSDSSAASADKGTSGSGDGSSSDAKPAPAAKSNGSGSKSPSSNGSAPAKVTKAAS